MKSNEIRAGFLEFFRERGHVIEKSDRIVPSNDPTLLFTSAGMVQFKHFYTGETEVPYRRAATSQKCLRAGGKANDLDEVGKTSRHLTFFEMLGNFSFGDYFKHDAIRWSWEFTTEILKFAPEAVVVSVYKDDDEAATIWEKEIGISPDRIVRLGDADNFWGPAGDTGACGPCSELLYDRGEHIDPNATLENDPKERYLEFWNLVFPQFDQQKDGSRPQLKNRGIDTGMGLERIAALLQNKETVFDTDGIFPIIAATRDLTKVPYEENPVPYRVIADHIRALSFMIADGILPGNEGRGYVFRRLLRRAARFGRELGLEQVFLHKVAPTVIDLMGKQYPELIEGRARIEKVILTEEERFASALARGMDLLENVFEEMKQNGETLIPGEKLFKLHDTYGFPLDLATDVAEERGYEVDKDGFTAAMKEQRAKARNAWTGSGQQSVSPVYRELHNKLGDTEFIGYDNDASEATIQAIISNDQQRDHLEEGETGGILLDKTPFYAESGGQVADTGLFENAHATARVDSTRCQVDKSFVHQVTMISGRLQVGDTVHAQIDADKRRKTENHHTATHLLQAALRHALGEHVQQAGSYVGPDRLRFDFTHFEGIDLERLQDVEREVNAAIRMDLPVQIDHKNLDDARKEGFMALFGEKYEDVVRVVQTPGISKELCGGCHVSRTGVIGLFKILTESAIAAGVRRIEAVCGAPAIEAIQEHERQLSASTQLLSTRPDQLEDRIKMLLADNKRLDREVAKWKQQAATGGGTDLMNQVQDIKGVKALVLHVKEMDAKSLRALLDQSRDKLGSGVVVLGSDCDGKVALAAGVTKDLTNRISAGKIVAQLAPLVGGGGGGRPDMAQAGGKDVEKLPDAMKQAPEIIAALLG
ncbi:MAG: alanine--tRNA ligase [Candidatus Hydrogenedentales bacterium]|jgi:alanyl-tRNA synthetase